MGKKNKNRNEQTSSESIIEQTEATTITDNEHQSNSIQTKKRKKKNEYSLINTQNDSISEKKSKKIKFGDDGKVVEETHDSKSIKESELEVNDNKSNKRKNKNKTDVGNIQNNSTQKPKKIKFGDDGEVVEVSQEDASTKSKPVNKRTADDNSILNIKEEDVKDEDIDQFCDDVNEEDNKQYESWIALLEQKLGGTKPKNKNKSKTK